MAKSLLWALPGGQVSKDAGVFGHEVFGSTVVFGVHAMHFQRDVSRSLLKGILSGSGPLQNASWLFWQGFWGASGRFLGALIANLVGQ